MLTALALLGFVTGADVVGYALTGVAVAGAVLNATTGLCVGCRVYLLGRRLQRVRA